MYVHIDNLFENHPDEKNASGLAYAELTNRTRSMHADNVFIRESGLRFERYSQNEIWGRIRAPEVFDYMQDTDLLSFVEGASALMSEKREPTIFVGSGWASGSYAANVLTVFADMAKFRGKFVRAEVPGMERVRPEFANFGSLEEKVGKWENVIGRVTDSQLGEASEMSLQIKLANGGTESLSTNGLVGTASNRKRKIKLIEDLIDRSRVGTHESVNRNFDSGMHSLDPLLIGQYGLFAANPTQPSKVKSPTEFLKLRAIPTPPSHREQPVGWETLFEYFVKYREEALIARGYEHLLQEVEARMLPAIEADSFRQERATAAALAGPSASSTRQINTGSLNAFSRLDDVKQLKRWK